MTAHCFPSSSTCGSRSTFALISKTHTLRSVSQQTKAEFGWITSYQSRKGISQLFISMRFYKRDKTRLSLCLFSVPLPWSDPHTGNGTSSQHTPPFRTGSFPLPSLGSYTPPCLYSSILPLILLFVLGLLPWYPLVALAGGLVVVAVAAVAVILGVADLVVTLLSWMNTWGIPSPHPHPEFRSLPCLHTLGETIHHIHHHILSSYLLVCPL